MQPDSIKDNDLKANWLLLLAPVIRFIPPEHWMVWGCMIIAILLVWAGLKTKNRLFRMVIFGMVMAVSGVGTLFSSQVLNSRLEFNNEKTIFGQAAYYRTTKETSKLALFLPYRTRDIVFNPYLGLAGEMIGRGLGKATSNEWLAVFLPIGVVSFLVGGWLTIKEWPVIWAVFLGWSLAAGIQILTDTRSLFYFLTPFWLAVSWMGIRRIPAKYIWGLSVFSLFYLF
jgi:hypothetical protein